MDEIIYLEPSSQECPDIKIVDKNECLGTSNDKKEQECR